jgi:hypothetical protein
MLKAINMSESKPFSTMFISYKQINDDEEIKRYFLDNY